MTKYLNENPVPDFNFLRDTSGISNSLRKDLIVSNIEGQLLTSWSYLGVGEGASSFIQGQWPNYLKYFYTESEEHRMKLLESTSYINFYGMESDSNHFSQVLSYFENALLFYIENYKYSPDHKFNIVICPTETIGMQLLNYHDYFNGGSAYGGDLVVELSPNYNFNQEEYDKWYAGLSAHEFFHIYYNHFMWQIPGGFWAEGSADFSARHSLGEDIRRDRFWMIEWTFNEYAKKYNIELDLAHISTNPNQELDIYYLGDMFFEYLFLYHGGYEKIKEFFNRGMDYSVFNATYEEIDTGYINYLKGLIETNYQLPAVLTGVASNIITNGATLHGEITFDGGTSITQRGFYWSSTNTSPNSGDHVETVAGTIGDYSFQLEGLSSATTYYFRAFATNSEGTSLGEVKQFETHAAVIFTKLPFSDNFEEIISNDATFQKWTTENLEGWHYWHIIPGGGVSGQCMRFENTDIAQNDWLITQSINCDEINQLKINFSNYFSGDRIAPKLFCRFYDAGGKLSKWEEIKYSLGKNENQWYNTGDLIVDVEGVGVEVAFQYQSDTNQSIYFLLDNFSVKGISTGSKVNLMTETNFKIYPNPVTQESVISFTTNTNDKVNLTVYDLQGRKICTLIDKNLAAGNHTVQLGNQIQTNGVYLCKLVTSEGISTKKLIVSNNNSD